MGLFNGRMRAAENAITRLGVQMEAFDRYAAETTRKLDKVEGKIDESIKERRKDFDDLSEKVDDKYKALSTSVEKRHSENRKLLYPILLLVLAALATRVFDYVHFGPPDGAVASTHPSGRP